MFNPLKMNPVEKRLLLGGLANGIIYWSNLYAMNTQAAYPVELKNRLDSHLPRNGEIIASVAPPAALWVVKKVAKSGTTKEKLADIGFGAALYGVPNLVHDIAVQTAYQIGVEGRPTARLPTPAAMSKYITPLSQTNAGRPVAVASSLGKYTVTS